MTKKITISVSDQLHQRMENWREKVNFSKVFRDAITQLIEKKEEFQSRLKGDNDMEAIVERLRKEKAQTGKDWFEIGKSDGLGFAKVASYDALMHALSYETFKELPSNTIGMIPFQDEYLGDYFSELFETYLEFQLEEPAESHDSPNDYYVEWESGWKEGVEAFWEEVKDKI